MPVSSLTGQTCDITSSEKQHKRTGPSVKSTAIAAAAVREVASAQLFCGDKGGSTFRIKQIK